MLSVMNIAATGVARCSFFIGFFEKQKITVFLGGVYQEINVLFVLKQHLVGKL